VANAQAVPAIPNRNSEGIKMTLRLYRSARIPKIGVKIMPGSVKKVIRRPISADVTSSERAIVGNAGAILDTPITEVSVTPKMM